MSFGLRGMDLSKNLLMILFVKKYFRGLRSPLKTISATSAGADGENLLNLEAPSIINGCQTITIANEYLKKSGNQRHLYKSSRPSNFLNRSSDGAKLGVKVEQAMIVIRD